MVQKLIISFVIFIFFFSCQDKKISNDIVAGKTIEININKDKNFELDTLFLEDISSTGNGFFRFNNDSIYYFDFKFNTVSIYDKNGRFIDRKLGKGSGPNEIASFKYHNFMNGDESVFFGLGYDLSFYSKEFERISKVRLLNFKRRNSNYNEKDFNNIQTYSFNYYNFSNSSNFLFLKNGFFYFPLYISPNVNQVFNGYNGNSDYFIKSKLIGKASLDDGSVVKVFGERSQNVIDKGMIGDLDFVSIYFKDDHIYVGHALDNDIQIYDESEKYLRNLKIDYNVLDKKYLQINSVDESEENWQKIYREQKFYYNIYISGDLIFRSYNKNQEHDGLIIINKDNLVADLAVPKRFSIIGEDELYFYADGLLNEKLDQYGIYKIKKEKL